MNTYHELGLGFVIGFLLGLFMGGPLVGVYVGQGVLVGLAVLNFWKAGEESLDEQKGILIGAITGGPLGAQLFGGKKGPLGESSLKNNMSEKSRKIERNKKRLKRI